MNVELGSKSLDGGDAMVENPSEQVCTIKNLDNGKEFVAKEIREDGMWNKLKEVGTGRQLTMEEFEMCVGHSPIVYELIRRQNVKEGNNKDSADLNANGGGDVSKFKKKWSWFKSTKSVASSVTVMGYKERLSSDERDTSSEKGGRRSSSVTDDSQDVSFHGPDADEDCEIPVWKVVESERKGKLLMEKADDVNLNFLLVANGSPEITLSSPISDHHPEKKRRGRSSISRKSLSWDHILVPETVFELPDKPSCSFRGHSGDVLDLSWSKSLQLLSSSMDKTVRLWDLISKACLRIFSHSDYITCIQFNPVDDRYFISGSLVAKVCIWSIPDRQVVDWNDLHEMVTVACYTPDGQGALVSSYKGSCRLYDTSFLILPQLASFLKQFASGSSSELLIISADSRIRVVDGFDLIHKFKGNSYIPQLIEMDFGTQTAKSQLPLRKMENMSSLLARTLMFTYVSVVIPWPGMGDTWGLRDPQLNDQNSFDYHIEVSTANHPPTAVEEYSGNDGSLSASRCTNSPLHGTISSATNSYFFDRI
ncbi:Protochlorophyllide oxidoreductase A [Hibiscus syriacus]|uniref:Protochlorophyllide oxidoreductase A n=1 Tax=Hibiscus syriacus TaxID=106335 RepID=A0A6A3AFA8_HIBSY|nr:Protochlorophyllide oxidoreductase A [Hibiscus syriacus]